MMVSDFTKMQDVSLFGFELKLAERSERDIRALTASLKGTPDNELQYLLGTINSALRINVDMVPKWRILKRRKLARLISPVSLVSLPRRRLLELLVAVLRLEGANDLTVDDLKQGKKKLEK